MRRRALRTRRADAQSLDSLLDTMTNVVGILIVLLAVTQLAVGGALERIRALADAAAAPPVVQPVASDPTADEALDPVALQRAAARLARELERARAARPLRDSVDASVAAESRSLDARADALSVAISSERAALRELQVRLESTVAALPVTSVRLPDPRTAPAGSRQLAVLCRYARCFAIDYPQLRSTLERGLQASAGVASGLLSPGTDFRPIAEYFDRHDLGDDNLRLRIDPRGSWHLQWRDERRGEALRQLRLPESRFRRTLDGTSPNEHYLTYFAWADSFEAYLGARELAEAAGYAAGWVPLEVGEELRQSLLNAYEPDPTPID